MKISKGRGISREQGAGSREQKRREA